MNGLPWTSYDLEFVRLTYGRIPAARIAEHLSRSVQSIYALARDQALMKSRPPKRPWTPYEREFVRLTYTEIPTDVVAKHLKRSVLSVYQEAYGQGLRKSERFFARPDCGRTDGKRGEANRFRKGHEPANKGVKGWDAGGRSAETRFKPGSRPQTWVPIGTVVSDPEGYLKKKVRDDAPPGMSRRNWIYLHVARWERYRGPVPPGHVLRFRNGDKRDIRIGNLELVSFAENARRNNAKRWSRPRWVNQAIAAKARLTREINKLEKRRHERD